MTLETIDKAILIKISEDGVDKAGFKLTVDEARAVRDALKNGITKVDEEETKSLNTVEQPSYFSEPVENNFRLFNDEPATKRDELRLYY